METCISKVRLEERSSVKAGENTALREEKCKEIRQVFLPQVRRKFYMRSLLGQKWGWILDQKKIKWWYN